AADMEAATAAAAAAAAANDAATRIPRFTADGRTVLRDALAIALELGHNYIGTQHLLLALFRADDQAAAQALAGLGAGESHVREAMTAVLAETGPEPPA
ncbi:MAG TPA: Clp protease N-terminal domain-containing protein, partial [Streptosporangiaceae bacterium]|nr:Clp protease N-terminal domain-containing protein [Streptosporangiaceae bacterium]